MLAVNVVLTTSYNSYELTHGSRYALNDVYSNRYAPAYNQIRFGYRGGYLPYYLTVYGPSYIANGPYVGGYQWNNVNKKPFKEGYGIGYDTQKDTYLFTY